MSARWSDEDFANYQARKGVKVKFADPPKANKYSAIRTEVDGIIFDSKREAARYTQLRLLERADKISDLRLQVKYEFIVNGHKIGSYTSDFEYEEDGHHIVEDSKGLRHRDYIWRRKLMLALFGITIRET